LRNKTTIIHSLTVLEYDNLIQGTE